MDFHLTEQQEKLRQEVRTFLEAELQQGTFKTNINGMMSWSRDFSRKLAERGWIGMTWPTHYGGRGWSYVDRLVVMEELLRYGAPVRAHLPGDRQIGSSIIAYGTEEQRQYFLPRIIKGEITFALGASEPGAGSDLAGLKTQALEKDGHFILNGQKVWTGGAHHADYIYLVARTDPNSLRHKGISEFIVNSKSPGINIRPLIDMTGQHHINEVYFDNVIVPRNALVGQLNRGWYQITAQLDYERSGLEEIMNNYPLFETLLQYGREARQGEQPLGQDPLVRHRLAELVVEYEVGRWLIYRVAWLLSRGKVPTYEAAQSKIFGTAFEQRLAQTTMQLLGLAGQLLEGSKGAKLQGWAAQSSMFSLAYTILGGTTEILRNLVATRGLGLPSE